MDSRFRPTRPAVRNLVNLNLDEATDVYIANEAACPRCNGVDLNIEGSESLPGISHDNHMVCASCGFKFTEHFSLSRITYSYTQPCLASAEEHKDE